MTDANRVGMREDHRHRLGRLERGPVSVEEGAKITSTLARTSSAASCGICCGLSAQRNSRLRFRPST